jgi:hypothetical protein
MVSGYSGRSRQYVSVATALVLAWAASAADGAPIRAVSPGTGVFLGNVLIGRAQFVEGSRGGTETSRRTFPVAGFYSPTTHTLLGLVVPYVEKRLEIAGVGEETTRGLGDISLIGHYRFWNRPRKGYRDMAAARVVLELPSGSTDQDVDLPVPEAARHGLQPGSGSTDATFILAVGRGHYRYSVYLNGRYRLNTEGDDFEFGDEIRTDLSLGAFLFPKWTRARRFEVLALLELSYVHEEKSRLNGDSVPDSGGDALFIAPGLQWIATERLLFEASLRLPAVEERNGRQPRLDHDLIVGFRFAF